MTIKSIKQRLFAHGVPFLLNMVTEFWGEGNSIQKSSQTIKPGFFWEKNEETDDWYRFFNGDPEYIVKSIKSAKKANTTFQLAAGTSFNTTIPLQLLSMGFP